MAPGHLLLDGEGHVGGEVDAVEEPQLHQAGPHVHQLKTTFVSEDFCQNN